MCKSTANFTNAITIIVFKRTYSFNNMFYGTNLETLRYQRGNSYITRPKREELPLTKRVSFTIQII